MNQTLRTTILLRNLIAVNSRCFLNNQINHQSILNQQSNCNVEQKRTLTRGRTKVLREMKSRSKDFDIVPHKMRHRKEWLDWNYDCEIFAFNNRLKERFDEQTLKKAFIFKSYVEQQSKSTEDDNEELEILNQIQLETNDEFIDSGLELCDRFISQYLRFFLRNVPEEGIRLVSFDFIFSILI